MSNGFAIAIVWLLILGVVGFYKVTTPTERFAWGRMSMGWLAVGIAVVSVYETVMVLVGLFQ